MWPLAKKTGSKKSAGRRGEKQTRSLKRRRRFSLFLRGMSVVMVSAGIIAGVYLWQSGLFRQWLQEAGHSLDREVAGAGFAVQEVRITGQKNTSLQQIRAALGLYDNQPMTSLDLTAMLARVEALPWVKTATISRILPNIVRVGIREHRPAALWQQQDHFYLITRAGEIITDKDVAKYPGLPQIVGSGANQHLGDLLVMKQEYPKLFARIKSSVWVGNRRWDLNCYNGIKIKLPESGWLGAWKKLYNYQHDQKILTRDILSIDLRLSGRTIVRLTPAEAARRRLILKNDKKAESI